MDWKAPQAVADCIATITNRKTFNTTAIKGLLAATDERDRDRDKRQRAYYIYSPNTLSVRKRRKKKVLGGKRDEKEVP